MGKTSIESRLNLPGKIGWMTMEAPGFITLLYIMNTLPAELGIKELPWENKAMAGLFVSLPRCFKSIILWNRCLDNPGLSNTDNPLPLPCHHNPVDYSVYVPYSLFSLDWSLCFSNS